MKPDGYSTVSPYLVVENAQAVVDFLKEAFGAEQMERFDNPDGSIMHIELRIGDSVVMLGGASDNFPAYAGHIHLYMDDCDAAYRQALAAGGLSVQEPLQQEGDADRRGGVRDPGGNTWWIGSRVK